MRWAIVGVVVGLKEDQHMPGSRQTVFLVDHSFFGMRIIGSEAMLGFYSTRVGDTHGRAPFDCAYWVRPEGEDYLVMVVWVRPDKRWLD